MALESNNNTSLLENIKVWDIFILSHNVQAPCFKEGSFQKADTLKITTRNEKSNETGTTGISFTINRVGISSQNHIMSLGIFINNFDQKITKINNSDELHNLSESTSQQVSNLI